MFKIQCLVHSGDTQQTFQETETIIKNHKEKNRNRHINPDILVIKKQLK